MQFWSFYSRWWIVIFGLTIWLAQAIQLVWKACWVSGWKKGCQPAWIKTSESAPIEKRDCKKSVSAIQVIGDLAEVRVNPSWDNHVGQVRQLLSRKKTWMWLWSFYSRWWLVTFGMTTWLAQALQFVWWACWVTGWQKGCLWIFWPHGERYPWLWINLVRKQTGQSDP